MTPEGVWASADLLGHLDENALRSSARAPFERLLNAAAHRSFARFASPASPIRQLEVVLTAEGVATALVIGTQLRDRTR